MKIVRNIPKIRPALLKAIPSAHMPVPIELLRRFINDPQYLKINRKLE
jgi:hypothetical protein